MTPDHADLVQRLRAFHSKIMTEAAATIERLTTERDKGHDDPLNDLVARFAKALLAKLKLARANGRSGWERDDWQEQCQRGLLHHVQKGDPRDVAAYCAFAWHHSWPACLPASAIDRDQIAKLEAERDAAVKSSDFFAENFVVANALVDEIKKSEKQFLDRAEKAEAEVEQLTKDFILATADKQLAIRAREWQPIETAPKDGSSFLACAGIWITVCHWHRHQHCWSCVGPIYSPYPSDEQPAHWMPLPSAPNIKESDHGE